MVERARVVGTWGLRFSSLRSGYGGWAKVLSTSDFNSTFLSRIQDDSIGRRRFYAFLLPWCMSSASFVKPKTPRSFALLPGLISESLFAKLEFESFGDGGVSGQSPCVPWYRSSISVLLLEEQ